MDITDTCCKHINAKVCDCLALVRICALAHSYNTVFFSADRTNFSFDRHSHAVSNCY